MVKTLGKRPSSPAAGRYTLGRGGFAKISAIEGIRLSQSAEERFADFDRKGLPAGERRRIIAESFAKKR